MYDFLVEASQYFIKESKDDSQLMSDIYHEISKERHIVYLKQIENLTELFNIFDAALNGIIEPSINELIENGEYPTGLTEFEFLFTSNLTNADLLLNYPSEFKRLYDYVISYVSKTNAFKSVENSFDMTEFEITAKEAIKAGVTAIAFEAFACEALLNLTINQFMNKKQVNQLKPTKDTPLYIKKLDKIIEYLDIDCDYDHIVSELKKLMQTRNKIAHYKEYKFDITEMLSFFKSREIGNNDENFYIGELFTILNENFGVYNLVHDLVS